MTGRSSIKIETPSGFADIHSHVLFGLDDGAKTIDESVAMLRIAEEVGTTDIVASPHANGHFRFDVPVVEERIAELSTRTEVRIHFGCDFHLQVDNIEDAVAHPEKYTIDHGIYLLVEFPDLSIFRGVEEVFTRLLDAGMVPIITHPERNRELRERIDDIAEWVDLGCGVQVTAASHLGLFGKPAKAAANELLRRGLTHFIASDAHNTTSRSPNLRNVYDLLADEWGEERIRPLFVDNPHAVLRSEPIDVDLPNTPVRPRKWYQFWS